MAKLESHPGTGGTAANPEGQLAKTWPFVDKTMTKSFQRLGCTRTYTCAQKEETDLSQNQITSYYTAAVPHIIDICFPELGSTAPSKEKLGSQNNPTNPNPWGHPHQNRHSAAGNTPPSSGRCTARPAFYRNAVPSPAPPPRTLAW